MSIDQLHSQIPYDGDDEKILQEILDARVKPVPMTDKVFRDDVPDIKTKEEEEKWQKIIDERADKIKEQAFGKEVVLEDNIKKLEEEKAKIEAETPPTEPVVETVSEKKPWCELCGSMGVRHKKGCPTLQTKE